MIYLQGTALNRICEIQKISNQMISEEFYMKKRWKM